MAGQLRGLLVDYGGVLTNPLPEFMADWVKADGIDPDRFAELMRRWLGPDSDRNPVHDLETGRIGAPEFERLLAAELIEQTPAQPGAADRAAGMLTRMFSGMRVEAGMLDVVRTARSAGVRTGLLSNSWGLDYERDGWDTLFDAVVISGEVGLRKPDPAIYALAAQRLGLLAGADRLRRRPPSQRAGSGGSRHGWRAARRPRDHGVRAGDPLRDPPALTADPAAVRAGNRSAGRPTPMPT